MRLEQALETRKKTKIRRGAKIKLKKKNDKKVEELQCSVKKLEKKIAYKFRLELLFSQ